VAAVPVLRIALIAGGPSAEAEVSRSSARGVGDALRATWPDVTVLELDEAIGARLISERYDVVFPVLHGPIGEDGTLQGFLEVLGLPYVGSGVAASAIAMNKIVAKQVFRGRGLPVARDVVVERAEPVGAAVRRIEAALPGSVVIKPAGQGSAIGVGFAATRDELAAGLRAAFEHGDRVLVEEQIEGKEITAAVLERPDPEALGTIEVRTPRGAWYDFEHRYTPGLSEHVIPAELPAEQSRRVQEVAVAAHRALGCRDLSRADFVVPSVGEPVLLEVNTLPGMTSTSLYPDAARAAGIPFEELVKHLVLRSWERRSAAARRSPRGG
jgi:D-alanine-D-alanine ligase